MSRFHFVISSSVFAVQYVISQKAVKKSRQNTNRLQDKGKRKCAGCFFIPLDASQLVIYSSFYPSCLHASFNVSPISGVKPELVSTILGEIYLESPCEMTFGPILLLNSSLLLSRRSSSFLPFTDNIRCCRSRKPRT